MFKQNEKISSLSNDGFSLIEVLVVSGILITVIIGLIQVFVYCSTLFDSAGNLAGTVAEAQSKLEEIRNHTYSQITTDYASGGTPGNTFNLSKGNGKGAIYIDSSNSDLLQMTLVVSWRNQNGRIVGEDLNLDGVLDTGEDIDSNNKLSSPTTIVSLIARR